MKQSLEKNHPMISEITFAPFGKRMAQAHRDALGQIRHYWIAVDDALFNRRLGPEIIASVIEPSLWFDISHKNPTFCAKSPHIEFELQACETSSSVNDTDHFNQIKVWCQTRIVATVPRRNAERALCARSQVDVISLVQAFSQSFKSFLPRQDSHTSADQMSMMNKEDNVKSSNVPFILVRESLAPSDSEFSRSMVNFH